MTIKQEKIRDTQLEKLPALCRATQKNQPLRAQNLMSRQLRRDAIPRPDHLKWTKNREILKEIAFLLLVEPGSSDDSFHRRYCRQPGGSFPN